MTTRANSIIASVLIVLLIAILGMSIGYVVVSNNIATMIKENPEVLVYDESGKGYYANEEVSFAKELMLSSYSAGSGSFTMSVEVQPLNATNKEFTTALAFINPTSAWAQGKSASDYISVAATADYTGIAINAKKAFSEPIVLTVASKDNQDVKATTNFNYMKRIKSVNLNIGGDTWLANNRDGELFDGSGYNIGFNLNTNDYWVDYSMEVEFTEGTITPEVSANLEYIGLTPMTTQTLYRDSVSGALITIAPINASNHESKIPISNNRLNLGANGFKYIFGNYSLEKSPLDNIRNFEKTSQANSPSITCAYQISVAYTNTEYSSMDTNFFGWFGLDTDTLRIDVSDINNEHGDITL